MIKVKTLTGDWSCRSWVYSSAACLAPNMQQQANSKRKQIRDSVFLLQLSSDHSLGPQYVEQFTTVIVSLHDVFFCSELSPRSCAVLQARR